MKQIWPTYAYSPTTNVLTLTGLNINRDQLLLVTAADRGRIMYNFADSSVTASAFTSGANTALTLVATTAGLTTTAALVIYFDDQATSSTVTGTVELGPTSLNALESITVTMGQVTVTGGLTDVQLRASAVTVGGTVTVGNSITIGFLPSISGTVGVLDVNAVLDGDGNVFGLDRDFPISGTVTIGSALPAGTNRIGVVTIGGGTVTLGAGTAQIGSVTASISGWLSSVIAGAELNIGGSPIQATNPVPARMYIGTGSGAAVSSGNPMPISGTVTIGNSVTIGSLPALVAGTAQIGSVTASISNSVTIASLPAISGTVTANLSISSTVITSGSFSSLASATLVPANPARKMATVFNLGAGQLFVSAGATATTAAGGFMVALSSGDFFECNYTTTTLSAVFATAGTASWISH